MFSWRLQLRTARTAVADGRWDEAAELLVSPPLSEFLQAKRLAQQLAGRLAERAVRRLASGDRCGGNRDLELAARLGGAEDEVLKIRRQAEQRTWQEALDDLVALRPEAAARKLRRLHGSADEQLDARAWQAATEGLLSAERLARQGDFAAAQGEWRRTLRQLPQSPRTAEVVASVEQRMATARTEAQGMAEQLHALQLALGAQDWAQALAAADRALELAPEHGPARRAQRRVWEAVGLAQTQPFGRPHAAAARGLLTHDRSGGALAAPAASPPLAQADPMAQPLSAGRRLIAWIDAVGGYLLCLDAEATIGQPAPGWGVTIPILGDLSRRHAVIRREGEAYLLTPHHDVRVDGVAVRQPIVLRTECELRLGDSVTLRFRRPHALSNTAVLEMVSHHKTEPGVDGIVLMSESCVLGPQAHSHIVCRKWLAELVLVRRGDRLFGRGRGAWHCDDVMYEGEFAIDDGTRVHHDSIALSFEAV